MDLQVNEALEDRKALEGQLRHLQAGLTEGQEAARQEGRQEMERLEARLKDVLKDRSVVDFSMCGLHFFCFTGYGACKRPLPWDQKIVGASQISRVPCCTVSQGPETSGAGLAECSAKGNAGDGQRP